jgi:phosphate transport system ATP-binding protein
VSAAPKLQLQNLSVFYGERVGVHQVDLRVEERQLVALLGPSGCGKSTLLRALNRMHDLSEEVRVEGQMLLDGQDMLRPGVDPVELRRRVGMVFQRSAPFPATIFENVAYGLRMAGGLPRSEIAARVEEALRAAALWDEVKDRLASPASSLSGGQLQRMCVARALANRPEVLLLDEPTSALDPASTAHLEELFLELKRRYTLLLVTHSIAQARRVSDRVAFFFLGRLVEEGEAERVLTAPSEEKTRAYLSGHFG